MQETSDERRGYPRVAVVGAGHWGQNIVRNVSELGALAASFNQTAEELADQRDQIEAQHQEIKTWNEELERRVDEKTDQLAKAQEIVLRSRRLAGLGVLGAGVAHEVNNPLAFIVENLRSMQSYAGYLMPLLYRELAEREPVAEHDILQEMVSELQQIIDESLLGAERVGSIVRQLHAFSNVTDVDPEQVDLESLVESSVVMVQNQIRYWRNVYGSDILCE